MEGEERERENARAGEKKWICFLFSRILPLVPSATPYRRMRENYKRGGAPLRGAAGEPLKERGGTGECEKIEKTLT